MQNSENISQRPTRWGWWITIAAILLLLGAGLFVLWRSLEPVQEGQPISYWITQLATSGSQSERVLDKIGPEKSIPHLLRAIDGIVPRDTVWERFYARLHTLLPAALRQRLPVPQLGQSAQATEFIQTRAGYYFVQLAHKHPASARLAVPQLASMLASTNEDTRFSAGMALSGYGSNAAPAIPTIEQLLRNEPEKIHDIMLVVLENGGAEAKWTTPTLRNCLGSSNGLLSIQCARTLWRLEPAQAGFVRPVAMRWTGAQDAGLRMESASLLWQMDKNPAPVVPVLIGLLNEDNHPFDYRTMLLLKQIGRGASNAIPALTERLKRSTRKEPFYLKAADAALEAMTGITNSNSGSNTMQRAPEKSAR